MDIDKINSIIELFKNSGLDEMTLELKDFKINLKNNKVEYVAKEFVNVVEKKRNKLMILTVNGLKLLLLELFMLRQVLMKHLM